MPERSFGRAVRYRRNKLGLTQAQLAELVGRSPSAVRSWERDKSTPTEPGVIHTLAAILGVDERSLFEKAGQQQLLPEIETSPTVEEALATLRPQETGDDEITSSGSGTSDSIEAELERVALHQSGPARAPHDPSPSQPPPGYVTPREPYVITPPMPPIVEPSYMEDQGQRQLYRVRNLATLVAVVALAIALIWAFSESVGALGTWWDEFFGSLRL